VRSEATAPPSNSSSGSRNAWKADGKAASLSDVRLLCAALPRRNDLVAQVSGEDSASPCGFSEVFRHYYFFAAILLDRVFLLGNQSHIFDIEITVKTWCGHICQRQGCFMVGAHLGSFEVVRTIGRRKPGLGVRL